MWPVAGAGEDRDDFGRLAWAALDRQIIDAIPAYLDAWGTHPSWSRLLGSPVLYEQIEERLTALLGCEDSLVLPTITHIHMSVIPLLAASGTIFLDARAHKTIYDGCQVAKAHGATVKRFPNGTEFVTTKERPDSVYFAGSDNTVQVEVYDPSPGRAMGLARSGRIVPAG